jgi:tRNA1Val (adenine37-N6)-methyltransferase
MHLGKKYKLIISNPPFFENDLKSEDAKRNLALHSEELSLQDLLLIIKSHLAVNGKFAVLLPYHRKDAFIHSVKNEGFFLEEVVSVKQTPKHAYFRVMLLFSTFKESVIEREIIIREGESYTNEFIDLLKDYYLKL